MKTLNQFVKCESGATAIEYGLIAAIKKRCVAKGVAVKKSEVLRAAIASFAALSDTAAMAAVQALEVIKTGRKPKVLK